MTQQLSLEPQMWTHDGGPLLHDEQHTFRYKVLNECGKTVGFVTTDRDRRHPDARWTASTADYKDLPGSYATPEEALAAF